MLNDDTELFVKLRRLGVEVVPPWSPEVSFLFDPHVSQAEARSRLLRLNITFVGLNNASPFQYLDVPLIRTIFTQWRPVRIERSWVLWDLRIPQPQAESSVRP
jgi:hypothetical protein